MQGRDSFQFLERTEAISKFKPAFGSTQKRCLRDWQCHHGFPHETNPSNSDQQVRHDLA